MKRRGDKQKEGEVKKKLGNEEKKKKARSERENEKKVKRKRRRGRKCWWQEELNWAVVRVYSIMMKMKEGVR